MRVNNVDQTVNGLGVGETTVLFFPGSGNRVTAIVDATVTVSESNENNNTRSEMVPVPTPPLPCNNPTEFAQTIVNRLNARNFDAVKALIAQQFSFAYWQSQGTSYTPDSPSRALKSNLNTNIPLVSDANKDLTALLGGSNPYTIMGLDPTKSQALFVSVGARMPVVKPSFSSRIEQMAAYISTESLSHPEGSRCFNPVWLHRYPFKAPMP